MALLDDTIDQLYGRGSGGGRRHLMRIAPEQEQSMVKQLASHVLGPIATLGHILGTPGHVVSSTLGGVNPLPGILDPEKRIGGRGMLENWGLLSRNRPGLDWGDVGGFAADVLTDPLTFLNPLGGLTKGGQALKNAGLLTKTAEVGGKQLGTRLGRMGTTVGELLGQAAPEAQAAAHTAAGKLGINLAEHLDKPLGGAVGVWAPWLVNTATSAIPGSTGLAKGLDVLGGAARYGKIPGTSYSPGMHLAQMFSAKAGEAGTKEGQQLAAKMFTDRAGKRATGREFTANILTRLDDMGLATNAHGPALRRLLEGVHTPEQIAHDLGRPELAEGLASIKSDVDAAMKHLLEEHQMVGGNVNELVDDMVDYAHRRASGFGPGGGEIGPFLAKDPAARRRALALKGIPGGTEDLRQFFMDPELNQMVREGAPAKDIAALSKQKFGGIIPDEFKVTRNGKEYARSRHLALAKIMQKLPEESRAVGLYGNHVVADMSARIDAGKDWLAATHAGLEGLASQARTVDPALIASGDFVPVRDVLRQMNLKSGIEGIGKQLTPEQAEEAIDALTKDGKGALFEIARKRGAPASAEMLGEAVPRQFADDLVRFNKGFKSPDSVNMLLRGVDTFNSLFKAGVLSWPARHIRDFVSGLHKNWSAGLLGDNPIQIASSLANGYRLARGGVVSGAEQIPEVAKILAQRGIQPTAENGTQVLRELAFANELVGPSAGRMAQIGTANGPAGVKRIEDLMRQMPGMHPTPYRETMGKLIGRGEGITLNPLDIQGVGGRTSSGFGPVAWSNDVGYLSDAMNRLTPWIEQMRNGVKSDTAARIVKDAQVDYSTRALTKTEKGLTRWVPFYRFTRGAVPSALQELFDAPGGKLAQTIRLLSQSRERGEIVPDYVNDTAGIRVPEGTPLIGPKAGGDPRYLTGLGLMFEELPGLMTGSGVGGRLLEAASHLGPIPKFAIEQATGKSLFQKGVAGPVDVAEQDPTIGRFLANVTGREEPVPIPALIEHLSANLPTSRIMTTLRTLTDPRKNAATRATNLLSGVKFSDVPLKRREAIERELLAGEMKKMGARTFEETYFPKGSIDQMSPEQQQAARNFAALQAMLAKRATQRAKAKRAAAIAAQPY